MVKAYFDYVQSHVFGLANRNKCKPSYSEAKGCLILACAELVLLVHPKTGEVVRKIDTKKTQYVSCLEVFEDGFTEQLSIGFEDGDIVLFQLNDQLDKIDDEDFFVFSEHDAPVQCIKFSLSGALMISGGADNIIVLWDVIGRTAKHKYTGHSSPITSLTWYSNFNDSSEYFVSTSKDGCLRVWDVDTRRCIDIIASKKNEVLGFNKIKNLKFVRNELFAATTNSEEIVFYEMKVLKPEGSAPVFHEERGRFVRNHYSTVVSTDFCDDLSLLLLLSNPP